MAGGTLRFKGGDDAHRRKRRRSTPPSQPIEEPRPQPARTSKPRLDTYVFDYNEEDSYSEDDNLPSARSLAAAEARLQAEEASRIHQDDFTARLFEELREDEPLDERYYMPERWQRGTREVEMDGGVRVTAHVFDLKEGMDDEAYAEHIRTGMWRRTHAEEVKRAEEADRAKKERERKKVEDRKKAQRAEQERLRRAERELQERDLEAVKARRTAYDQAWSKLVSLPVDRTLRSSDFPWPVSHGDPMDAKSIAKFLLGHLTATDDDRTRKKALRAPLLAYHPDRFARLVERVPEAKGERQMVRETALRVSQLLNDLLAGLS